MKKTIITGALLIAMIGFNEVNILPTFLSEHIVHADTKIVEDSYFTISNSNSDVYISFREGKLALYATNKNVNSVPGAQITILKENTGRMEGPFNPNTLTIYSKYITQGTNLEVGDKIFIRFLEAFPNCWTGNGNARAKKGETQLYEVKADGALKKLNIDGAGQAQVTYNVNTADPDDPTANPDFTVLIPTKYQLSNKQKVSAGAVALKDAKDVT
ncbi:hypothetical protein HQ955_12415 [Enterococcus faecium]|nr:hypothetical protein [Enterococcus faecium]EME7096877.1 hypothetical protein [Enterococcus faecium]EMF0589889.1 hypothetical protein [Enterococcus faecium]NTR92109.1 hypothetical protein [Enterococcus faecium]